MGSPPPIDLPPPGDVALDASAVPVPTGPAICGFPVPGFAFNVSFRVPGLPGLQFPPQLFFALALRCDLSDPIDASFGWGGGRQSNVDPGADDEFGEVD